MWELIATIVADAIVGIGGPLVAAGFKTRAMPKEANDLIKRALLDTETQTDAITLTLAADMADAHISPDDNRRIVMFLSTPEGIALLRMVAVESVLQNSNMSGVISRVSEEAKALLELAFGSSGSPKLVGNAAPILAKALCETTTALYNSVKKKDTNGAQILQQHARNQRTSGTWVSGRLSSQERARMTALSAKSGGMIKSAIEEYGQQLAESFKIMSIPTIRVDTRIPLAHILVRRTYTSSTKLPEGELLNVMTMGQRLVLLGDPGEGKSTAVVAGALELASRAALGKMDAVPIRLQFRHLARYFDRNPGQSILDYMATVIGAQLSCEVNRDIWFYLLTLGRCVVFFDGLDEAVDISERRLLIERVESFIEKFPLNSYLVTCRHIDYPAAPLDPSFEIIILDPFTPEDVRTFAQSFFGYVDVQGERSVEDFLDETKDVDDIRSNALMLGVLCNLYSSNMRMPRNRHTLYKRCAEMLFGDWDASKGIRETLKDELNTERAVRQLAWEVFNTGQEEFSESLLRGTLRKFVADLPGSDAIAGEKFASSTLELWRGRRWLIEYAGNDRGEEVYRFTHRTFMEFFAAEHLVYISRDGFALFRELHKYILDGTATSFCLLAVEWSGVQKQAAATDFLSELVTHADTYTSDGEIRSAGHLLHFALQSLAFLDSVALDVRDDVSRALVGVLEASSSSPRLFVWAVVIVSDIELLPTVEMNRQVGVVLEEIAARVKTGRISAMRLLVEISFALTSAHYTNPIWRRLLAGLLDIAASTTVDVSNDRRMSPLLRRGLICIGVQFPSGWIHQLSAEDFLLPASQLTEATDTLAPRVSVGVLLLESIPGLGYGDGHEYGLVLEKQSRLWESFREVMDTGDAVPIDSERVLVSLESALDDFGSGEGLNLEELSSVIGLLGAIAVEAMEIADYEQRWFKLTSAMDVRNFGGARVGLSERTLGRTSWKLVSRVFDFWDRC